MNWAYLGLFLLSFRYSSFLVLKSPVTKILASLDDAIFGYVDGAADGVIDKVESLLDMTVANFISEHSTTMSYGSRGYAGNLVAMRDGLIVTHAAVYDPSLLKDENPIVTVIESASDNKLKLTKVMF